MKKNGLYIYITLISLVLILVGIVIFSVSESKKRYEYAFENPITRDEAEEELEMVFLSTDVYILNDEREKEYLIFIVEANGFCYRVLYELRKTDFLNYHWKYVRYIQISEESL